MAHHLANGGMSRFDKFNYYHHVYLDMKRDQFDVDRLANQFSKIVMNSLQRLNDHMMSLCLSGKF